MIYVTGDTHGPEGVYSRFSPENPEMADVREGSTIAILGDFGVIWNAMPSDWELDCLGWMESLPYEFVLLDGNHENHARLSAMPVEQRYGGYVHRIAKNISHLIRGQVLRIDERTIFCMGGAHSPDRRIRLPYISWWPEEAPSADERSQALCALGKAGWHVDMVWTHCPPHAELKSLCKRRKLGEAFPDEFSEWLQNEIAAKADFGQWLYGHMHVDDSSPDGKYRAFYERIVTI